MPLLDRYWQTRIALAAFLAFVAVAFAVRFLPIAYVVDQRRHIAFWPDALFTAGFCLALLGFAVHFARSVQTARERVAWREEILLGAGDDVHVYRARDDNDDDATPLANHAPMHVTLIWRHGWFNWIFWTLFGPFTLIVALVAGFFVIRAIWALFRNDIVFFYGFAIWGTFVGPFLVVSSMLFMTALLVTVSWDAWRPAVTITASEDGVTRSVGWRKCFVRWEDMRLLERVTNTTYNFGGRRFERKHRYILYSRDATISWDDVYSRRATYRQRAELLATVERRAHLRVRAFK